MTMTMTMHNGKSHADRMAQNHTEFDANDYDTRRRTLRSRNLREMARPWRVTGSLMRYLNVRTGVNMTFHQGARIA